jgi:hypothetical protein
MNIICYISLAVWKIPAGWKWTCYILAGAGYGLSGLCMAYALLLCFPSTTILTPSVYNDMRKITDEIDDSWAHEICSEDNEERALVIGSMNEMAYVFQAWLPLVVWQQVDGPRYRKGFITVSVLSVILIGTALWIRVLDLRERSVKYVSS